MSPGRGPFHAGAGGSRLTLRPLWLTVPLVFVILFLVAGSHTRRPAVPDEGRAVAGARSRVAGPDRDGPAARLVIILVDSLRPATLDQPGLMPNLAALARRPGAARLDVRTCASNFSLPCIQTIFSGRESPMAGGIQQFAGYGASRRDLVGIAAAAGLEVALVGNDMLSNLYGHHARATFSVIPLGLDPLPSDRAAIARARDYLHDPANDIVVLHTNGTDHVTHYDLPGTPRYAEHFHAVDAALGPLLGELDMTRDSLVVMGDHGHDNEGHHARNSVAIFAGQRYAGLFEQIDVPGHRIEQKDLLYLLAYPHGLRLTPGYEGRFFALRAGHAADAHLAAFLDLQRQQLLEEWRRQDRDAASGSGHAAERAVAARMRPEWQAGNDREWRTLVNALPLLACLLLWIAWTYGRAARLELSARPAAGRLLSAAPVVGCGSLAILTWLAQGTGVPPPLLALVPLGLTAWLAARQRSWRVALILALLLAGAVGTAAIEPAWRSLFHSRDEFHWGIPVFYVLMLGAGALLAIVRRGGALSWPSATQLAAFVALPAGVYYYQFDENPLRAYLIPALLLLGWLVARHAVARALGTWDSASAGFGAWVRRGWRAAVPLALTGLLLLPQDAGGWQWHSWLAGKLRGLPPGAAVATYAVVAAWLLGLLGSWRRRAPMAALLLVLPLYVAGPAGLELPRLAAALVLVLFAGAWMAVDAAAATAGPNASERDEMTGLMLAAASMAIVLTTFDGLAIDHVDFTFALRYAETFRVDAAVFLVVAPLVAVKYASPVLALLAFHRLARGPAATERAIGFLLLFLNVKLVALLLQALVGALDTGEKFFELAQTDFIFVACLIIVVGMWTAVLWAADGIGHALGLTRSAVPRATAASWYDLSRGTDRD